MKKTKEITEALLLPIEFNLKDTFSGSYKSLADSLLVEENLNDSFKKSNTALNDPASYDHISTNSAINSETNHERNRGSESSGTNFIFLRLKSFIKSLKTIFTFAKYFLDYFVIFIYLHLKEIKLQRLFATKNEKRRTKVVVSRHKESFLNSILFLFIVILFSCLLYIYVFLIFVKIDSIESDLSLICQALNK